MRDCMQSDSSKSKAIQVFAVPLCHNVTDGSRKPLFSHSGLRA